MRNDKTRIMVEAAIMVALATVLSFIRIIKLPLGVSVTLLSMLPIIVFSVKRGVKYGMAASFLFSLIQLGQGIAVDGIFSWGLTPLTLIACIMLDYVGAYSVIGLGGIFREKGAKGIIAGTILAVFLRFAVHFTSGVAIWHSFGQLWDGFSTDNTWLYSLLYNGAYMLPEMIFTAVGAGVIFSVPQTKRVILQK